MYKEPEKIKAREKSIFAAVDLLTRKRSTGTIADRGYLRRVWEKLNYDGSPADREINNKLTTNTITRWETFYDSIFFNKKPENLKVAYLCGPDPINDLKVLSQAVVLPENVWAFESDKQSYLTATQILLNSQYPFVKIVKTDIKNFVEFSNIKFDIIYLDFCGPIYNRGRDTKNIETLTAIAKFRPLTSPGVLISNFALMTKDQDEEGYDLTTKLVAGYLFPKDFLEDEQSPSLLSESMTSNGIHEAEFLDIVKGKLGKYYSQFVTRLIQDLFEVIVPADRLMNTPKILRIFFDKLEYKSKPRYVLKKAVSSLFHFSKNFGGGDIFVEPGDYALPWTLFHYLGESSFPEMSTPDFKRHAENFARQLSGFSHNTQDFFEKMSAFYMLKGENGLLEIFYSDSLKKISQEWRCFNKHIFFDGFLFYQLKDLLI